jgi:SAM-dependent methyltransferase
MRDGSFGGGAQSPPLKSLPVMSRCPSCHETLEALGGDYACQGCGREFPTLDGVPVLTLNPERSAIDQRATGGELTVYDSAELGIACVSEAFARGDQILELGAGLDCNRSASLVTTDGFVYGTTHLDVVADAHALPFADASFDFVFSLAVFEHLHSPWIAAAEIARVLRPGGRAYTLAAFLQPLHGYPDHYFNATERALARLFSDEFDVEFAGPSRHCPHRESLVPNYRMREMAIDLRDDSTIRWRERVRAWRLVRSLTRASYEFAQLAEQMSRRPAGYELWRQIAPAVEVLAVRR